MGAVTPEENDLTRAALETHVRWAREFAFPPSRDKEGKVVGTLVEAQDRAERYARWRYQGWLEGDIGSAW